MKRKLLIIAAIVAFASGAAYADNPCWGTCYMRCMDNGGTVMDCTMDCRSYCGIQ